MANGTVANATQAEVSKHVLLFEALRPPSEEPELACWRRQTQPSQLRPQTNQPVNGQTGDEGHPRPSSSEELVQIRTLQ